MGKMNKQGFTLSEVLITLGVIGIVAAMTLPTLLVHNRERENTAKLKKIYSTMTQAYTRAVAERGTPDFWDLKAQNDAEGAKNIKDILAPYFAVTPDGSKKAAWNNSNTMLLNKAQGPNLGTNTGSYATFSVVDGMSVAFNIENPDCKAEFGDSKALKNVCATFIADVNGAKRPNQFGFDIFKFYITKYGIQPYGGQSDTTYAFEDSCKMSADGYGCAAWVVFRNNLDYFHCEGLNWDSKAKCKGLSDSKYDNDL